MTGISPSISATASWCTLAIPRRMKTMHRRGADRVRHCGGHGHPQQPPGTGSRSAWRSAWASTPGLVVGEMGGGGRQEQLALGDTPNIAARLQGLAAPDTVVISAATQRLIQGYFTCHALGGQTLKGVATPLQVYQVVRETEVQQRFDVAVARGLTPLVGREHEVGICENVGRRSRLAGPHRGAEWEAGIGKSRLVQVVKDEIIGATALRIEYRCSPSTPAQRSLPCHRPPGAGAGLAPGRYAGRSVAEAGGGCTAVSTSPGGGGSPVGALLAVAAAGGSIRLSR